MSQEQAILSYLRSGKTLTPLEALRNFQTMRLSGRIKDLKDKGHNIINEWERSNNKRFAKYRLIPKKDLFS